MCAITSQNSNFQIAGRAVSSRFGLLRTGSQPIGQPSAVVQILCKHTLFFYFLGRPDACTSPARSAGYIQQWGTQLNIASCFTDPKQSFTTSGMLGSFHSMVGQTRPPRVKMAVTLWNSYVVVSKMNATQQHSSPFQNSNYGFKQNH